MVYLGYNFDTGKIKKLFNEPECVQLSLSDERLEKAKEFLKSVSDFIGRKLGLFRETSSLSKETVGISIMENFVGEDGFPSIEEKQCLHTDYPVDPS
jgi:hypothetical protein